MREIYGAFRLNYLIRDIVEFFSEYVLITMHAGHLKMKNDFISFREWVVRLTVLIVVETNSKIHLI